jgi:predicted ATPase
LLVRPLDATGHLALIQNHYQLEAADQARLEHDLAEHAEGNPLYAEELLQTLEGEQLLTVHQTASEHGLS